MKEYIKYAFVLFIVAAVASGILAFVDSFTKPVILKNQKKEKELARKAVLPQATVFDSICSINNEPGYVAKDDSGNIVGYTFVAAGYGYSSNVKTMVGLKSDFSINKIK
jgi:electron transport complex protein RnfG